MPRCIQEQNEPASELPPLRAAGLAGLALNQIMLNSPACMGELFLTGWGRIRGNESKSIKKGRKVGMEERCVQISVVRK